jgi:hypothetical protein
MNKPVIAYQLPYTLVGEQPEKVGEAFNMVYDTIMNDPDLSKVTHIIGNSTGSMFASKIAATVATSRQHVTDPLSVALVQTGTGWCDAMERTQSLFARQLRHSMRRQPGSFIPTTFEDFRNYTTRYDPITNAPDLAREVAKEKLHLSLFFGMGDKMITPDPELVNPLLESLDGNGARGKYEAYSSDVVGHNASMLYFLWLSRMGASRWSEIFSFPNSNRSQSQLTERIIAKHTHQKNRSS